MIFDNLLCHAGAVVLNAEPVIALLIHFVLPGKIKRTIKADGYVSGQYHLTMDQDQIMELLVGEAARRSRTAQKRRSADGVLSRPFRSKTDSP